MICLTKFAKKKKKKKAFNVHWKHFEMFKKRIKNICGTLSFVAATMEY